MYLKSIWLHIILLYFSCNFYVLSAQQLPAKKSFSQVLKELETRFGCQFNYASSTAEDIEILTPSKELSLDQWLQYLNQKTALIFTVLEDNFISVKKPELKICGYLKEKKGLEPIGNATIKGAKNATITNENGYFELEVDSENELFTIRHVGYRKLVLGYQSFKNTGCSDIYLVPEEMHLSEVVLSGFLIRGIDKFNDGSYHIDFDKFSILPGLTETDVLQSIQALPGIQSINETVSDINIRGGTNDQNLILWDDIKMYQSGHFFGLISMYNPQITQKVSLRKNGTPVSLTDGVSGTIAMETDRNINNKFEGNISVNFLDANAFTDIPLGKKSSIQIAARKAIDDFVESPTYTAYFDRISQDTEIESTENESQNSGFEFDFHDQSLRWLYKPTDKDEVQLNFINATNELVFNEKQTVNGILESRRSSVAQNSIAAGLQHRRTWNDGLQTAFKIYETDYTLRAINANILEDQRFLQRNTVSETGVNFEGVQSLSEKIKIKAGYTYVDTKVTNLDDIDNPQFVRRQGEVLKTHALFTELGYVSKNSATTMNGGLRYNYLSKFNKHIIEPRFSFNQRFLKFFNLEVLGEFKHQNTSQIINFQNGFLGIEKRRWQLSNDKDIPVITSKQVSSGLSYMGKGWLVNAVGYFKDVAGITSQSQGFQNQYAFDTAVGSYESLGLDVLLRKQFKKISTWLSYSYLTSEYTFNTLPETNFPNNYDIVNSITIGSTYTSSSFLFSAGLNWRSGKPFSIPIAGNEVGPTGINYGPVNNTRLIDYLRVDASAMYQLKVKDDSNLHIGVSVWNLLNKENTINTFYRLNAVGNTDQINQNALGITPNFFIRVYF